MKAMGLVKKCQQTKNWFSSGSLLKKYEAGSVRQEG